MRRNIIAMALAVAVVGLVAVAAVAVPGRPASVAAEGTKTADASEAARYITVVGQGEAKVSPDVAILNVGADNSDAEIRQAIDANNEIMDAVVAALTDAGIEDTDIQTSNFSIYRDQSYVGADTRQAEPQYRVSNMVTVTIRDLETVGGLLDDVVTAGANTIYGVTFTREDWSDAQSEARANAVADAAERASQLADLAGVELGGILSVSEVVGGQAVPMAMVQSAAMGYGGGSSVSPGQLSVSMSVQVTYAVE